MKKLLTILSILSLSVCITGCKKNKKKFQNTYEIIDQYFSNDKEVTDIRIKNVPKDPIEIGYFSQAGITLEVSYIDGKKQTFPVTEGLFPKEDLNEFKTPGDKYFDIIFKNKHIALKFTLKEPEVKVVFKVRFLDKDNNLVEEKLVDYLSSVTCSKESAFKDYEEKNVYYKFEGKYDIDLENIYFNTDVKPVYKKYLLYNSADGYTYQQDVDQAFVVSKQQQSSGSYTMHSLVYLGRYNNFVIQTLDTVERTEYKSDTLSFSKNKNAKSDMAFKENILNNVKNVLSKGYKHTTDYAPNPQVDVDIFVQDSYKLNFDLSQTNSVSLGDSLLDVPSCITTSLDGYSFSGLDRNDGIKTSNKSLFESNADLYLGKYMQGGTTFNYTVTPDYKLGYYQAEYICDLDVYLDIEYRYVESAEGYLAYVFIDTAKIAFAYDESTLKFNVRYNEENDFSSYSKSFTISDGVLGNTCFLFL